MKSIRDASLLFLGTFIFDNRLCFAVCLVIIVWSSWGPGIRVIPIREALEIEVYIWSLTEVIAIMRQYGANAFVDLCAFCMDDGFNIHWIQQICSNRDH